MARSNFLKLADVRHLTRGVLWTSDDEVGLGGVTGHGDRVALRRVRLRGLVDVVRDVEAVITEVDAPASDVRLVREGCVGRQVGHEKESQARISQHTGSGLGRSSGAISRKFAWPPV